MHRRREERLWAQKVRRERKRMRKSEQREWEQSEKRGEKEREIGLKGVRGKLNEKERNKKKTLSK